MRSRKPGKRLASSERARPDYLGADMSPFIPQHPAYWKGYSRKEDEELAEELFFGRTVWSKTGRAKREYLVKDSARERSAIKALIRLLSRDDWSDTKDLLFDALKSDGRGERRLVFQFRRKGKRPNLSTDYAVAIWVAKRVSEEGWKVEAAVSEAMSVYGLSRKAVFASIRRVKVRMRLGKLSVV
jgi:hypothetical protein